MSSRAYDWTKQDGNSSWRDFVESISSRNGTDVFYHPKYYEFKEDGSHFYHPWWACISRFMSRWHDRFYLIGKVLDKTSGWLLWEDDYGFGCYRKWEFTFWQKISRRLWERLFYVLKTVLCILFLYSRCAPDRKYYDTICVACWDFHPSCGEYSGTDWMEMAVGHGYFRNWFFREFSDSSC